MLKIIDKCDTGKTKALLQECAAKKGIFVCKHPEKVVDKCKAYGIDYSNITPLSYVEAYAASLPEAPVFVDELDEFVKRMVNLKGYTLTLPEGEWGGD